MSFPVQLDKEVMHTKHKTRSRHKATGPVQTILFARPPGLGGASAQEWSGTSPQEASHVYVSIQIS